MLLNLTVVIAGLPERPAYLPHHLHCVTYLKREKLAREVTVIISRRALAREGDYEMMSVCACVRACVRALVSHADFSKTTTATDFL